MKKAPQMARRWRCAECPYTYVSPIPVAAVEHRCKAVPVPGKKRQGMVPDE